MTTTLQLHTRRTGHHDRILDALNGRPEPEPPAGDEPDDPHDGDGPTGSPLPIR